MELSSTKSNNNRNSAIECIKLIAIVFIICSSALPYGATYGGTMAFLLI